MNKNKPGECKYYGRLGICALHSNKRCDEGCAVISRPGWRCPDFHPKTKVMSKIEEKLDMAAIIAAANYDNPFDEPAYDKNFYDGFKAGANWMLVNQWRSVEDELPPTDGNYITLIKQEESFYIEIAPWRHGEYQGSQIMAVKFGPHKVTHWMPIPPFLETIQNSTEK